MPNSTERPAIVGDDYVLTTGEEARARLHLLDRVYGDTTRRALRDAGITRGMHVADIGSGVGDMTSWVASQVGSEGRAIGVDVSPDQVATARQNAARLGATSAEFQQGDAYATGLPRASFDIVYCRALLCHLARVADALNEMRSLLKPGGSLVCVEPDWASTEAIPFSEEHARFVDISCRAGSLRGADFRIGLRLHSHLRDAGFTDIDVRYEQPAYVGGMEKRFAEFTMIEAAPAFVRAGLMTDDDLRELREALEAVANDETRLVIQPRVGVARGRVSAS